MNETSLALYRKYRPDCFPDVRNQDHIVSVLQGAIKKKMIPHALLFTGSRGTGKTTVARIFAHEIGATELDIYEIDAASNRGIDDIRELKESVHTLPYESPYKVYIIDEVHMLTKEAFSALLKTLEEPPSHVIFILATTEREKLLDTITSRCQIFEFRTPSREELQDAVKRVAKKEKLTLDNAGADVIALAADGSYRDALGIVQKVMMAGGDSVLTVDEVAEIVGAPKSGLLRDLVVAFGTKDIEKGLGALRSARETNVDIKILYKLLLERVRSIILLRYLKGDEERILAQCAPDDREDILRFAHEARGVINSHLTLKLIECGDYIGKGSVPELPLELVCIEHCTQ